MSGSLLWTSVVAPHMPQCIGYRPSLVQHCNRPYTMHLHMGRASPAKLCSCDRTSLWTNQSRLPPAPLHAALPADLTHLSPSTYLAPTALASCSATRNSPPGTSSMPWPTRASSLEAVRGGTAAAVR